MDAYIPVGEEITPAWLTAVLRQAAILKQGEVKAVESRPVGTFNSETSFLSVNYSVDAPAEAPTRFVLKRNTAGKWGVEAGIEEVKFYNLVNSLEERPPAIVPCYAAATDPATGNSYLLLQDFSETHISPITRAQQISIVEGVPSVAYLESVAEALAQLHAYWWNHPLLHTNTFDLGYWSRDWERFEQYLQRRTTSWESLIAAEESWFPNNLRKFYAELLIKLPGYWERYLKPRFNSKANLTLIHGDAYMNNFLCPKEPKTGPTYLLDWQTYSFDIGASDLVNFCATFWTPQQRHEEGREEKILRHYYAVLQAQGIQNYSWDDLLTDYKISLIYWILMPLQDYFGGSDKAYWWPKMQCLVAAFQDWHCENLLNL